MELVIQRENWVVQGSRLSALTAGQPGQPMLLLLHGIPASAELWREVLPLVGRQGWYAVAPDLPGYGHTRATPDSYSLRATADLVAAWLTCMTREKTWVVGHDLGGLVAQYLMVNHQEQLLGATLVNSPAGDSWPVPAVKGMMRAATKGLFAPLAALGMMGRKRLFSGMKRAFGPSAELHETDFIRVFYDGKFDRLQSALRFQRMLKELNPTDSRLLLEHLPVNLPVHLIWGMADKFQPWTGPGEVLQQKMPQAEVVQLLGVGHYVPMEQPRLIAEHIDSVLGKMSQLVR
jgi:pimeloyl-ACP methyl ester carboxylesterase